MNNISLARAAPAISLPALSVEVREHAGTRSLLLSQEAGERSQSIELHPLHVGLLADKLGLRDLEIERLHRALLRSWEMSARVQKLLQISASHGQEDLEQEVAHAIELVDFLAFICVEFDEKYGPLPQVTNGSTRPASPAGDLFEEGARHG